MKKFIGWVKERFSKDVFVNSYNEKGYCVHGRYVGGCGIDWICPYCEDGVSEKEYLAILKHERKVSERRARLKVFYNWVIKVYFATPEFMGKKLFSKLVVKLAVSIM